MPLSTMAEGKVGGSNKLRSCRSTLKSWVCFFWLFFRFFADGAEDSCSELLTTRGPRERPVPPSVAGSDP